VKISRHDGRSTVIRGSFTSSWSRPTYSSSNREIARSRHLAGSVAAAGGGKAKTSSQAEPAARSRSLLRLAIRQGSK